MTLSEDQRAPFSFVPVFPGHVGAIVRGVAPQTSLAAPLAVFSGGLLGCVEATSSLYVLVTS